MPKLFQLLWAHINFSNLGQSMQLQTVVCLSSDDLFLKSIIRLLESSSGIIKTTTIHEHEGIVKTTKDYKNDNNMTQSYHETTTIVEYENKIKKPPEILKTTLIWKRLNKTTSIAKVVTTTLKLFNCKLDWNKIWISILFLFYQRFFQQFMTKLEELF